nr:MAG TPA: hypothetical protein [Caudoviricetes sp.]
MARTLCSTSFPFLSLVYHFLVVASPISVVPIPIISFLGIPVVNSACFTRFSLPNTGAVRSLLLISAGVVNSLLILY